tara:strand:+ start:144 stop:1589 length:1446 start_codon:yes stop_codon:yes gene_type:complete
MDKVIKINSVEGGPFTATQNICQFVLPEGNVYDLNDSYINLNVKIDAVQGGTKPDSVSIMDLQWKTTDADKPHFQNVALVKNCRMTCDRKGLISDIRRVDILKQNLATYDKSQRQVYAESYLASNQLINPLNSQHNTIYRDINKTGNVKSRTEDICPVQVKLSDLFDFCHAREFDTSRAGQARIHLELNVDKLEAVQNGLDGDWTSTEIKQFEDVNVAAANTITTKVQIHNLNDSPYYVGQQLAITSTPAATIAQVEVSNIEWDKANSGVLKLTFDEAWGAAGVTSYTAISVGTVDVASAAVSLDTAEVVLKTVASPQGMDAISYDTFSTEQTNGNKLLSFQSMYQIEPEATNVVIMFPTSNARGDLISNNNNINSWRLRLNNDDLTDRNIDKDSPLSYDRKAMTLANMGSKLRNLKQNNGSPSEMGWVNVYNRTVNDTTLITNPLVQTQNEKLLQVNIEAGGDGVEKLVLFKQLPRVFSY